MKLLRIITRGAETEIRLDSILDTAIFAHCTGGLTTVKEARFKSFVEPVLRRHGVESFEFEDINLLDND